MQKRKENALHNYRFYGVSTCNSTFGIEILRVIRNMFDIRVHV